MTDPETVKEESVVDEEGDTEEEIMLIASVVITLFILGVCIFCARRVYCIKASEADDVSDDEDYAVGDPNFVRSNRKSRENVDQEKQQEDRPERSNESNKRRREPRADLSQSTVAISASKPVAVD